MKPGHRYLLVMVLSLAAAWTGVRFGQPSSTARVEPQLSPRKSLFHAGPTGRDMNLTNELKKKPVSRFRAIFSCCSIQTLREKTAILSSVGGLLEELEALLDELYEREGIDALQRVLDLTAPHARAFLAESFLDVIAKRDPWLGYEFYMKHRGEYDAGWGSAGYSKIVMSACAISADRFVELMEDAPEKFSLVGRPVEFAPGFDFQKLALHESRTAYSLGLSLAIKEAWMSRNPEQALAWALDMRANTHDDQGMLADVIGPEAILSDLFKSKDPSAEATIGRLQEIPENVMRDAWATLGGNSQGKLDPVALARADDMNQRENYLIASLAATRSQQTIDPGWESISSAERASLIQELRDRQLQYPGENTPVKQRAFQKWQERFEASFK